MRKFIVYILPFALPFILYGIYWLIAKRRASVGKTMVPWLWLTASGLVLVVATAGTLALTGGEKPGSIYVPPRVVDGVLKPGEHVPRE